MKPGRRTQATMLRAPDNRLVHAIAGAAFLVAFAPHMPLLAQGLDSSKAIDTIIGSDVETEKESATTDRDQITKAVDNTSEAISAVHKSFNLDKVEIVFVPDLDSNAELKKKIAAHSAEIQELREAIEGNAMFFHAIDSRGVNLTDIVAVNFTDSNGARIYTVGQPPAD